MAKGDDGTTRPKIDTTDVSSAATAHTTEPRVAAAKGRSGGVVDAPGKKHRKPMPTDPGVDSQAAKVRMAKTMVKTNRRRGRG